jgi:hypothetical protein
MASRKEEKERLRAERQAREREAAAAARRRRLIGYGAGGALALAAVVAIVVVALAGGGGGGGNGGGSSGGPAGPSARSYPEVPVPPQRVADLDQAARAAGCTTKSYRSEGRKHVTEPVRYGSSPPHSGPHDPVPADDGVYDEAPRTEALVHSLEHGRIVMQFRPQVSEEIRGQLKSLYDEDPSHMVLVPNARMPYEVAATAWTNVLGCPKATPAVFDAIRAFKVRYRDRGPEYVP